jgi:hypothetical protein
MKQRPYSRRKRTITMEFAAPSSYFPLYRPKGSTPEPCQPTDPP